MNKKYIIGGMVIVLAVLVGFLFGKKAAIAPSMSDTAITGSTTAATTSTAPYVAPKQAPKTTAAKVSVPSTTSSTPVMTKSGAYLVQYTANGFVPKVLTIKKGQSVHFVNYSNKAMSLTAIDQNSQIYRNFNQEQSVGIGGYFDFSFVTAGTWGYMNRNSQTDRGTIIVE